MTTPTMVCPFALLLCAPLCVFLSLLLLCVCDETACDATSHLCSCLERPVHRVRLISVCVIVLSFCACVPFCVYVRVCASPVPPPDEDDSKPAAKAVAASVRTRGVRRRDDLPAAAPSNPELQAKLARYKRFVRTVWVCVRLGW